MSCLFLFLILITTSAAMNKRITHKIKLPSVAIGTSRTLTVHQYGNDESSLSPIANLFTDSVVPSIGHVRIFALKCVII